MPSPYSDLTGALAGTRRIRAEITRPANTTAYTIGDIVAGNGILVPIAFSVQGAGEIIQVALETNLDTVTLGLFRVHFFTASFVTPADNAPFTALHANRAAYLGYTDLPTLVTDAAGSGAAQTKADALRIPFEGTALFAVIIALGAYVPASGQVISLSLGIRAATV